jgi:hypothetical protein
VKQEVEQEVSAPPPVGGVLDHSDAPAEGVADEVHPGEVIVTVRGGEAVPFLPG